MTTQGARAYQQTSVTTTDPATLILMLYDGAIKNLFIVREGINENDIVKRGEHLSKAIAIISELLSSVRGDEKNEVANFLKNIYSTMLTELVKVNLSNDIKPLELSIKYLAQMRDIWKKEVINGEGRMALETMEQKIMGSNSEKTDKLRSGREDLVMTGGSATYSQSGFAATV